MKLIFDFVFLRRHLLVLPKTVLIMLKHYRPIAALLIGSFLFSGTVYATTNEEHGVRSVQQEGACTGTVLDETGMGIIGASVVIKDNRSKNTFILGDR